MLRKGVRCLGSMFREWKGAKVSYNRQGYIFFISRNYKELSREKRAAIDALCRKIGGEDYAAALKEFMTSDRSAVSVCMRYCLSKGTLYRYVRRYYEEFPREL